MYPAEFGEQSFGLITVGPVPVRTGSGSAFVPSRHAFDPPNYSGQLVRKFLPLRQDQFGGHAFGGPSVVMGPVFSAASGARMNRR